MKTKKNRIKSKHEDFNVWDVYTSLLEVAFIMLIVLAILFYIFQPIVFIDIKIP
jgi:heme/copper-type cytochrome/quinol oxidase subunit 2